MRIAVPASPADSEFPAGWERPGPVAQTPPAPRSRASQQWAVWIEFVLFCLAPALGFCLAHWWP